MPMAKPLVAGGELLDRVRTLINQNRVGAARPMLNALLRLVPACEEVAGLQARLLLLENRPDDAMTVLNEALTLLPLSVSLLLARAAAREHAGDLAGAARDAAEAVVADPSKAAAKAFLGAILNKLGRHVEAHACLAEAVVTDPGDGDYRQQLAAVQAAGGDTEAAAKTLDDGISLSPAHLGLRTAAILSRMRAGDFAGAEEMALATRRMGIANAGVLGLLGHARACLGHHDAAAECYAAARQLAPEDRHDGDLATKIAGHAR